MRHVVVGPDRHGVIEHATNLARACGHELVRVPQPQDVQAADLAGSDVVHFAFTDHLFGETIEAAVASLGVLADLVEASGATLSVTLHDVPHDDSPLQVRRRRGYEQVIARCRGVVVNSELELQLLGSDPRPALRSLRAIPLPIPTPGRVARARVERGRAKTVGMLGFLYPDRGYEQVIDALSPGHEFVAIGEPSAGHDGLAEALHRRAERRGVAFRITGFVPDDELPSALAEVDVAIAANRRSTASASINAWTAHGRRVLVPDSPYTREVTRTRPHCVITYDPAEGPGTALHAALRDPAATWLDPADQPPPTQEQTAARYLEHLQACRSDAAIRVGPGRWTVPGNRWDLLACVPDTGVADVSVVVPWFEDQHGLDRLFVALAGQTHPASRLEVIVADDGSSAPPDLTAAGALSVRTVRQDDHGFRAAAARNLGVAQSDGEVVVFLDADMVPEPDYVTRLSRLPALAPDCLTVGRRRHADLAGWSTARVASWLEGEGDGPVELPEPEWLAREYVATRDLLDIDQRSYRFVISAVLAAHRELLDAIGGFDETFVAYGGEDWDLAHRAYVAGGVFAHVRDAVAWHDGPDWAERHDPAVRQAQKAAETQRLARVLPDPVERRGQRHPDCPAVVVRLGDLDAADTASCLRTAAGTDATFWHRDADIVRAVSDPHLLAGHPSPWTEARATFEATVDAAADLSQLWQWCLRADEAGAVVAGPVTVRARRQVNRARRWDDPQLTTLLLGRHDVPTTAAADPDR